jgi:hypothetical protein
MVKIINVSINKKTRLGATYKERDIRTEEGTNHILKSPRLDAAKWEITRRHSLNFDSGSSV